jgi:Na+-driven multidrug efflux pump
MRFLSIIIVFIIGFAYAFFTSDRYGACEFEDFKSYTQTALLITGIFIFTGLPLLFQCER